MLMTYCFIAGGIFAFFLYTYKTITVFIYKVNFILRMEISTYRATKVWLQI